MKRTKKELCKKWKPKGFTLNFHCILQSLHYRAKTNTADDRLLESRTNHRGFSNREHCCMPPFRSRCLIPSSHQSIVIIVISNSFTRPWLHSPRGPLLLAIYTWLSADQCKERLRVSRDGGVSVLNTRLAKTRTEIERKRLRKETPGSYCELSKGARSK